MHQVQLKSHFERTAPASRCLPLKQNFRPLTMTTEPAFNRLSIAVCDFEQAAAFADEAQRQSHAELAYEALVFAAIVSYYRPFSPNEKDENAPAASCVKIEDFSPLSNDEASLHKTCKKLRNQALAHSEYRHSPTRLNVSTGVIASRSFRLLARAPDVAALSALAQKLATECHHKRADYVRRMRPNP